MACHPGRKCFAILFLGCNASIPQLCDVNPPHEEGKVGADKEFLVDYDIAQVQVLMRHGARSNHHHITTQTNSHIFSCELDHPQLNASLNWPKLLLTVDADSGVPLAKQPPWSLGTIDGKTCESGMLLPKGVKQMRDLGILHRKAYGLFLTSLEPENVYVRALSTPPRVLLSAASFMEGLVGVGRSFDDDGGDDDDDKFKIHIHSDLKEEAMQGLPCPQSDALGDLQEKAIEFPSKQVEELGKIFGISDFLPHTIGVDPDVADITFPALCDGGELPCGPGGCISNELQVRLDRTYNNKWLNQNTGHDGGKMSSQLKMYPLLAEVARNMAKPSPIPEDEAPSRPKLAVYAGRDFVIATVAGALGIFDGVWPSFGSHITLELWEPKATHHHLQPMVRALYNGKDVTSLLEGCGGGALCPLSSFESLVQGFLGSSASHEEACNPIADNELVV